MLHRRRNVEMEAHEKYRAGDIIPVRDLLQFDRPTVEHLVRERIAAVPFGPDHTLSRLLARYIFLTSTHDVAFAPHVLLDGYWEMWLTEFMIRTIKEGWTCLDIGANYGYFSVLMGDLVGPSGKLLAFEPGRDAAAAIQFSLDRNGLSSRSKVFEAAVAKEQGTALLYEHFDAPSNSQIISHPLSDQKGKTRSVPTVKIDEVCENLDRVDFIKLDAEGAEADILSGAEETIGRCKPIIVVEFSADRHSAGQLSDFITAHYDKIEFLKDDGEVVPTTIAEANEMTKDGGEVLLVLGPT